MRSEVYYKAFVGDDSGFLEPIHYFPDINVGVAARVSDGEEGVFNNHLVGNVTEMYLHVLQTDH